MKFDFQHLLLLVGGPTVSAFVAAFMNGGGVFTGKNLASAGVTALVVALGIVKQMVDTGKVVSSGLGSSDGK